MITILAGPATKGLEPSVFLQLQRVVQKWLLEGGDASQV